VISARKQTFANPISTKRSINIEKAEFGRGRLLRSGCGRSPGTMELNHFLHSGHSQCRSNFVIFSSPNLVSRHSRATINFFPWQSALQRLQPFEGIVHWAIVLGHIPPYRFVRPQQPHFNLELHMIPVALLPILSGVVPGASIVAHSSGGLILSGANGYVAGTFISTALIKTTFVSLGLISSAWLCVTGALAAIWGSAGIFGTTVGASGIKGFLMATGVISSTPVWMPVACIAATGAAISSAVLPMIRLIRKLKAIPDGQEAIFTEKEAKMIEHVLSRLAKRKKEDEA
jgi:hypothetical protein